MNAASIEDIFPLSSMHEGFLFQSLYDPDPEAYFVQMNFRFRGAMHVEVFREAWNLLSARHGVLRSAFLHEGLSRPAQVVLKQRPPEITCADLTHLAASEQQAHLDQLQRQDRRRGFDLARDVLMRIAVFKTGPAEHHVLWSFHHILLDGWSVSILRHEFVQVYTALTEGRTLELAPVFPYGDYLRWLAAQDSEDARRYWRDYLSGYQGLTGIPQIGYRGKEGGYALQELTFEVDADTTSGLRSVAARANVTLNTLVQCLWAVVLSRYNNTSDVVFGMIVSGRPPELDGVERMVGLCINAVAVRIRPEPERPFTALLQASQRAALESQRRHHLPLPEIQAQGPLGRELFDHLLTFENYPVETAALLSGDSGGFTIEPLDAHDRTHYPFTFIATPADRLHIRFSFNSSVYREDQMRRTLEHFLTAARSVLKDPEQVTGAIGVLPETERRQLMYDFNDTKAACEYQSGLVGRFETVVDKASQSDAVVCGDRKLTYRELNERANQLAHYLRDAHQVQPDERVGLLLDRSECLPVAVWGILKAGAAYVPIDPGMPPRRMRHMLTDSACRLVVSEARYAERAGDGTAAEVIDIRRVPPGSRENPTPVANSRNLAYVIYTSGSTGLPKGCQIELGNLVHYLSWADRYYFQDGAGGTFGLYSPVSFDLTVTSLFLPLLRGKALHVFPSDAELLDIFQHTFSEDSPIDSVKLTPSHISLLRYLRVSRSNVTLAIVGGEALSTEQVRLLQSLNPNMAIYNEYGPTETTVGCVVKRMEASEERVLIGKPITNTRVYVVREDDLVPIGTTGELLIGGAGVGRGYIRQDQLNEQAFGADPWRLGERVYRTGDLGRWLSDGNLELLGRADHQVKIRGYRIELGEIEHQLALHPAVRESVVAVRDRSELVAYLTAANGGAFNLDEVRAHLAAAVPEYMMPSHFVRLDEFPLTRNGKVDRKALPDPSLVRAGVDGPQTVAEPRAYLDPRDEHEQRLLEIWRDVLERDRIGVLDNFFRLGGHSLKAMQIASQIHKRLGVKVALRQIFQLPTIAELASALRSADKRAFVSIEPAPTRAHYDLSHAQQRLWLEHQMEGAVAYNIPRAFALEEAPSTEALNQAFRALIRRHEALRTAFVMVDGEPKQQVLPELDFHVDDVDLRTSEHAEQLAREYVDELANTAFDLTRPPLLRAAVLRLADRRCVFAFTLHHIIGDAWSEAILYREMATLYEAFRNGQPDPLRPLRIQYKDFAVWQNRQGFQREEEYWLRQLNGMPDRIRLPYDFMPKENRDFLGGTEQVVLPSNLTAGLRDFAADRGTTLSNVVLAVFKLFLFRWTRQEDICVGMSVANRNHPDTESLIGFFVNMLPIRTRVAADMEFDELVREVAGTCREGLEHQDYPFDLLVQKLKMRLANRQSLVNVAYNYLTRATGYVDGLPSSPGQALKSAAQGDASSGWRPFEYTFATSKFDLTLFVFDDEANLFLTLEYDSHLFRPETVRRALASMQQFAEMLTVPSARTANAES